ncbi:hypothetical protein MMC25_005122 [Agyrium rufum]|nr:hypothetical protein [Agyrium rufum]
MAKQRPSKTSKSSRRKRSHHTPNSKPSPTLSPSALLAQASTLLQTGQPDLALAPARQALAILSEEHSTATNGSLQPTHNSAEDTRTPATALPALSLLATIYLELGNASEATSLFQRAASIDPDGLVPEEEGGGAEKFLWLAQLCEEGGEESVGWFERGVEVLRRELGELEERLERLGKVATGNNGAMEGRVLVELRALAEEKRRKIGEVLCGVVEVYMTDLSWDPNAEAICETNISAALLTSPSDPAVLQTLASIRLSQSRLTDAQSALRRSLALWQLDTNDGEDGAYGAKTNGNKASLPTIVSTNGHKAPQSNDLSDLDANTPDFPTRISLARLLMEAEMEEEALGIAERLILEDDQSVEAWYLGGWCLNLLALRPRESKGTEVGDEEAEVQKKSCLIGSREWLRESLKLCELQEYEDDRLRDHAVELVRDLGATLGEDDRGEDDGEEAGDDDEWEGVASSEDDHEDMDADMDGDGRINLDEDHEMAGG